MGPVVAKLFGVTVYIYLTGKKGTVDEKRTVVYHQKGDVTIKLG